jgi:hypothetical protein
MYNIVLVLILRALTVGTVCHNRSVGCAVEFVSVIEESTCHCRGTGRLCTHYIDDLLPYASLQLLGIW